MNLYQWKWDLNSCWKKIKNSWRYVSMEALKVHSFQYYLGSLKINLLGWIFILFPEKQLVWQSLKPCLYLSQTVSKILKLFSFSQMKYWLEGCWVIWAFKAETPNNIIFSLSNLQSPMLAWSWSPFSLANWLFYLWI